MPRFFYGNFDFEHRLADPDGEATANLKRLNAELACCWLAAADDGDWVWTPSSIDRNFFREAALQGLPRIVPVTSPKDVPAGTTCIPWGWSNDFRKLASRFSWSMNAPSDEAVAIANSRATSDELERSWKIGLSGAQRVETVEQLQAAIRAPHLADDRWVVKARFSMSARERILGRGPVTDADLNWVRRRLATQGALFFEPWVERVEEIGIQIDVPQRGEPRLLGITPMIVDARGQYAGSYFSKPGAGEPTAMDRWSEAIAVGLRVATHLQSLGYFGPLGIDAMAYRDAEGSLRIRPVQDINARWTMGRLSLEWRRLLKPGEQGLWQHGSAAVTGESIPFEVTRVIRTSPERVGEEPCRHASRILVGAAATG